MWREFQYLDKRLIVLIKRAALNSILAIQSIGRLPCRFLSSSQWSHKKPVIVSEPGQSQFLRVFPNI